MGSQEKCGKKKPARVEKIQKKFKIKKHTSEIDSALMMDSIDRTISRVSSGISMRVNEKLFFKISEICKRVSGVLE